MMVKIIKTIWVASCLLLIGSGCSISYSVDQSSESIGQSLDSISASFESITSISTSSGSGKKEVTAALARFKEDIAALTRVFTNSDSGAIQFETELGELSEQYGVLDWEHEADVFVTIGTTLGEAGITEQELDNLGFLQGALFRNNYHSIIAGLQQT